MADTWGPRPSLAAVLTRRTEGNPFYVLELVRLLQGARDRGPGGGCRAPGFGGVRDVIRLRIGRMPHSPGLCWTTARSRDACSTPRSSRR